MKRRSVEESKEVLENILSTTIATIMDVTIYWLLWNWIMAGIFNLPHLNWIEIYGLCLLIRGLFRGPLIEANKKKERE